MRKRAVAGLAALAGLVLLAAGVVPDTEVGVPLADIQQRIDSRLPAKGSKLGADWTVDRAALALSDDGKARLDATVRIEFRGREATFAAAGSGAPAYSDGAFRLRDVSIEDARLLSMTEKRGTLSALGRAAAALEERGMLKEGTTEAVKAAAADRAKEALRSAIEGRALYTLKSDTLKGAVTKAVLSDVKVDAAGITVGLDLFGTVARWILFAAATLLLAFALLSSGGAGLGATVLGGLAAPNA